MITLHPVRRSFPPGFTLVELLVVIAIVGLLISILLPALAKARAAAHITRCASNLRGAGVGIGIYLLDHRDWMMTFSSGQAVYPLAATQTGNHVSYSYSRSLWPDATRGCPNVLDSASAPAPLNFGLTTSGLTGATNLFWGYELPAVNEDAISFTGGARIVDAHPDGNVPPASANGDYEYIRLVDGEVAKNREGTIWIHGGKRWDPNGTRPLAADMISYHSGSGRMISGHMAGGGPAKRIISSSIPATEVPKTVGVTGGNQLWHDFHVKWESFNGPPVNDYRLIATGQAPEGMTSESSSRMFYFFAKRSRRIE